MTISFLYPKDPFNPKQIDDAFIKEAEEIKNLGFNIYMIDVDSFDKVNIPPEETLLYRGWMLTQENYQKLDKAVNSQLIVDIDSYLKAHHLPNWYNELKDYTMPSIYGNDTLELYKEWGDKPAFVKDYVKSIKTGASPIVSSLEELNTLVERMTKYRGFIEGGIVLREPQELDINTETRFFVLNNKLYFKKHTTPEMLEFAEKVIQNVNIFFYSMDLVKNKEGKIYLIEIGDGQVSDSVGWDNDDFCKIFQALVPKKTYKP